ncbi:MAG TPA: AraC family transcriptional regulator ligand-binding domain-containing protein [Thermoanaerobaculia bacterium]|nr:AraC family transcriptional regulator ligand-binding domain-containing protein [Thermoanaerobaculia bacterium]
MNDPTVAASAARALMDFAIAKGCALAQLVRRSGIDPAGLHDDERRIPLENYIALMRAAKELSGDPAFALHFGESDEGIERSFACMMGVFSPTMAEALAHPESLSTSEDRIQLERVGDQFWAVDTRDNAGFPEGAEANFARSICAGRRLFPGFDFAKELHFRHAEPSYRAEYDRVFRIPIVFGSDRNAVLFDGAFFALASQAPASRAIDIVKARAESLLQRDAGSTRERVEELLASALHTADVHVDSVAGRLGVGRHTLFRKLKAEGVTFKQVLDELRRKLAVQYLGEKKLAVGETAYLLGFSDPAAFSRAYKRWTGHSPRARN